MQVQMNRIVSKEAKDKIDKEAEKRRWKPAWVLEEVIMAHDFDKPKAGTKATGE
jgi:hypothetical protein